METQKRLILFVAIVIGIIIAGSIVYFLAIQEEAEIHEVEFHEHADMKVYINEKSVDFSVDRYQTGEAHSNEDDGHAHVVDAHLHDNEGGVLHMHAQGVSLGQFFQSLGINFTKDCFILDNNEQYCNSGAKTLKMYVNGKKNLELPDYVFSDLDKILITYGDESSDEILSQQQSVTDDSCIYSLECPERGTPPEEGCVGDGGCPIILNI